MPRWDFNEVHSVEIAAGPADTFEAIREVTALDVRTLVPLMALRALPVALRHPRQFASRMRRRLGEGRSRPVIQDFLDSGFIELGVAPDSEIAFGAIGRFWSLIDNQPLEIVDASAFTAFDEPRYVKGALNFVVEPLGEGSRITTETRVVATSLDARRAFGRYWRLILPGSALIRRSWLGAIRRRAERSESTAAAG
jgi:hypothetical protein